MSIRTLQTIPQEPEETTLSGLLQGLAICLLSLTLLKLLGPAGILVAAVILLLRRYLLREDYCEDWAETCCCEQGSYDADAAPEEQRPTAPVAEVVTTRVEHQAPPAPVVDAATRRRRAAEAAERRANQSI